MMLGDSHELWQHKGSGEKYAVRKNSNGQVSGVCGPLHHSEWDDAYLPDFDYDQNPEDVGWIINAEDEFTLHEVS